MIVVTGSVTTRQDSFDEVRRLSLEHVHRPRGEPGCISHAVQPLAAAATTIELYDATRLEKL